MFKIIVEKECGCFKRYNMKNNIEFDNKNEALEKAKEMLEEMNETWCGKHNFKIVEKEDNINIIMENN